MGAKCGNETPKNIGTHSNGNDTRKADSKMFLSRINKQVNNIIQTNVLNV